MGIAINPSHLKNTAVWMYRNSKEREQNEELVYMCNGITVPHLITGEKLFNPAPES